MQRKTKKYNNRGFALFSYNVFSTTTKKFEHFPGKKKLKIKKKKKQQRAKCN